MNNEPAFPVENAFLMSTETGMTMRDYFAAKAMQALITAPNVRPMIEDGEVSRWAYKMADAMLKEREQ
jgi:hypothetical protein